VLLADHHGAQICVSCLVFRNFIDKLNNGFYTNVPAVAPTIHFDDFVNILSVPLSGNTFFSNFMFGTSIIVQSDYCLATPTYPAPGLFITCSVLLWFRPTGTVPYRPRAARSGSCLLVSILLLLSGNIESNPDPAQPTSFNFGCLNVRSVRNKAPATFKTLSPIINSISCRCLKRGSYLMTYRLLPTMLHRMASKSSTSLAAVNLLDRQRRRRANKTLEEAWLSSTVMIWLFVSTRLSTNCRL